MRCNDEISYTEKTFNKLICINQLYLNKIVGYSEITSIPKEIRSEIHKNYRNSLYLMKLFVEPQFRGIGFGKKLIERTLDIPNNKVIPLINYPYPYSTGKRLEDNELVKFYLRYGFKPILNGYMCYNPLIIC